MGEETTIPDNLKCTMCEEVFIDPVMDLKCQHTFCKDCIIAWIKSNKSRNQQASCPVCRKILCSEAKLVRNFLAFSVINDLHIHCSNHSAGCKWTGTLDKAASHISKCIRQEENRDSKHSPSEEQK